MACSYRCSDYYRIYCRHLWHSGEKMKIRYQDPNHPFTNEGQFRGWLVDTMRGQGWHAQPLEDQVAVGVPDLSAAHPAYGETWLELKLGLNIRHVNSLMALRHKLTEQQRFWLRRRQETTDNAKCGVLVGFSTGLPNDTLDYISWVPVSAWDEWMGWSVMTWCLHPRTAALNWIQTNRCRVIDLATGTLTPGWRSKYTTDGAI